MIKRRVSSFFCGEDAPIVETKAGKLHGYRSDDVYCFKGIEYAWADRFQMPRPVKPWEGVKDALAYGPGCPEMTYSIENREELDQLEIPGRIWSVSEHCQNLNVWTKSLSPDARRPVMVWLHGGGFAGGASTHLYSYDGFEMANEYDVVLVSINHRLNMFGFLDLSDYGEKYAHSGNAGMADIVAALEWVRENIAAFGGDPDNVTIYGQSGGGGKVVTLLQMPSADGLYHRAIAQSGIIVRDLGVSHPRELAAMVVEKLGLTRETIGQIETMDAEKIGDVLREIARSMDLPPMRLWAPVPEEGYYAGHPLECGFRGENKHIPLIVGSCIAEFGAGVADGDKSKWTDEQRYAKLKEVYGDRAEAMKDAFRKAYPDVDWSYAAIADNMIRPVVIRFLDMRCEQGAAPCYNYMFNFESLLKGGRLLGHNSELHFMFHNAVFMEALCKPGVTEKLQDEMAGAWAQFAYAGNPNRTGLPVWKAYTPENRDCLRFCGETRMVYGHDRELVEIMESAAQKHTF